MRVLHISIDIALGGIESFLLNVYKRIDKERIQFDFIEYGETERTFDFHFSDLGAVIYKVPDRKRHPIQAMQKLREIIKEGDYKVVHIHKNSLSDISAIKICQSLNVPAIIIHSHNSNRDNKIIVLFHKINRRLINLKDVYKLACSKKAAEWMYGSSNDITILNNGIDTKRFDYNKRVRCSKRIELCCEDDFIIGTIGRLTEQKNPFFAIDLLHVLRTKKNNIKLLWVGDGELRKDVEDYAKKLNEEDNVIFTGAVKNPEDYYQVMDMFIMPSFYEGFPIAAIEAQVSGLPCVLSSYITEEAELTEMVYRKAINDIDGWVNIVLKICENPYARTSNRTLLSDKGFDIDSTVEYLQKIYMEHEAEEV